MKNTVDQTLVFLLEHIWTPTRECVIHESDPEADIAAKEEKIKNQIEKRIKTPNTGISSFRRTRIYTSCYRTSIDVPDVPVPDVPVPDVPVPDVPVPDVPVPRCT